MPSAVPLDTGSARSLAAYAVATAVVCWLAVVVPLVGRARYRALESRPTDRVALYRRMLARQWSLVGVVVAGLAVLGQPVATIGLRWGDDAPTSLLGLGPAVVALLVVTIALRAGAARHRDRALGARLLRPVTALLPVDRRERRHFAAVAASAGVGEEILYRGLLIGWLATTAPALGPAGAVAVSSVVFGLAHAYQGPVGVAVTTAAGYALGSAYVATGSLLAPVVLHAAVDLRVLLLLPAAAATAPALTSSFPPQGDRRRGVG